MSDSTKYGLCVECGATTCYACSDHKIETGITTYVCRECWRVHTDKDIASMITIPMENLILQKQEIVWN